MFGYLLEALRQAVHLFTAASVYLLFGFFFAGLIHAYFPTDKISRYFGGRNLRAVFNASILGIPLPLCSCAVIPTAIALRKNGASRGATISFLISTPETGVDSIGVSFALLDPLLAIFRPVAALFTALTAGLWANLLERRAPAALLTSQNAEVEVAKCDDDCGHDETLSLPKSNRLKRALKFSFGELLDDLALWLIAGFLIAGLITALIPADVLTGTPLGKGIIPMLVMLAVGVPLYICATASTPIAAALILKGLSPGAALVFLLAGPATNIASLVILSRYLEKRFLAVYLATIAGMSLLLGGLLNLIYGTFSLDVRAALGSGSEFMPGWLEIAAAGVLVLLILYSLIKKGLLRRKRNATSSQLPDSKMLT